MKNYHNLKIGIFAIVLLITSYGSINAQHETKLNIGAGIITTNILGDNRAKLPMVATNDDEEAYTGGSFKYSQPGILVKFTMPLENNEDLRFSGNLGYIMFGGRERIVINKNIVHLLRHNVDMLNIGLGAEYVWANLDFANAKIYSGLDLQGYYVHGIKAELYEDYLNNENFDDILYTIPAKSSGMRFGGNVKLGVEGILRDNFHVNLGASVGIMNLLGRDDERGELFTPLTLLEDKENIVSVLQVFILIQYNF
jgi:hypothetical protein